MEFSMFLLSILIYYVVFFLSFAGENPEKRNIYDFCIKYTVNKERIEHPSRNVQDFYCLLMTLATCLISIEYGVSCSPVYLMRKPSVKQLAGRSYWFYL